MGGTTKDSPRSQTRWEREEQVLLVVEYFSYKNDPYLAVQSDVFLSEFLKHRASCLGLEFGEKFRNVHGIQSQRENMSHCDPESDHGLSGHESVWMYKIVNEYLLNPQEMVFETYEIIKKYR